MFDARSLLKDQRVIFLLKIYRADYIITGPLFFPFKNIILIKVLYAFNDLSSIDWNVLVKTPCPIYSTKAKVPFSQTNVWIIVSAQ